MLRARIPTSLTAAPDKAALTYRSFSIQGKQAATLLSRRLKVPVTEDHPASKGLAVLVHADRRPQTIETNGEERTFFGPSLIVKSLAEYSRAGRSEAGDIGLLGLTQARLMGRANNKSRRPRLKQSPLPSATEDAQKSAISRLLTRGQFEETLAQGRHSKAVWQLLRRLTGLFCEADGIWFTLFVHDAGDDGISMCVRMLTAPAHSSGELTAHHLRPAAPFPTSSSTTMPCIACPRTSKRYTRRRSATQMCVFHTRLLAQFCSQRTVLQCSSRPRPLLQTAQATDGGLFYIKLHNGGNIGSFGYGAGNAMATMDGLALAGGKVRAGARASREGRC